MQQSIAEYRPRGAALQLFTHRVPEICLSGPAGTGKTRACLEYVHCLAQSYPQSRHLILRKTRASLTESVLVTLEDKVLVDPQATAGAHRANRHSYRLRNGSEIVCGGLDKVSRIMSTEYDTIYIAEATEITFDDFDPLLTRLRNYKMPWQQVIMDCNPASPAHWIYRRAQQGTLMMLQSKHADNPSVRPQYLARLRSLTGTRYQRLYLGNWVSNEGAVYPEFGPECMVQRFDPPKDWLRLVGIDFGFVNPASVQWWARSGDGVWYLYRELYQTGLTADQLADAILQHSQGENVYAYYSDHDAQQRAMLRKRGIYTQLAVKDVRPGIEYIGELMAKQQFKLMVGSLIQVDETLKERQLPISLSEELPDYTWNVNAGSQNAREAPEKENDHACFPADTPVLTRRGWVPIAQVNGRDEAATSKGWRAVRSSVYNGCHAILAYSLVFGDLVVWIKATPDHKVWTHNRGWTAISSLRPGDRVSLSSCLAGGDLPCIGMNDTLRAEKHTCTIGFGSDLMGRAQKECTSTIRMETQDLILRAHPAHGVAAHSKPTNSHQGCAVHTAVLQSIVGVPAGVEHVYTLEVDGAHEYIAAGLLVKNCDAMRYALYTYYKRHSQSRIVR